MPTNPAQPAVPAAAPAAAPCAGCFSPSHRCPYCGSHVVPAWNAAGELLDPGCCGGDPEGCPDCSMSPCHPQLCERLSSERGSEALFDVLVDVAVAYVRLCGAEDAPDPENPASFAPRTFGGISYKESCLRGLAENLDLRPDLA